MCGIVGIHFRDPNDYGMSQDKLERFVNELLLGIEPRGKDATGLVAVDANAVPTLIKADTKAETFVKWRDALPNNVRTVLGHTRFATQGTPTNLDNDHPVVYGTCYAIHNGHISNDAELFKEHSLERHAEVDSEIIPALFDKYGLDKAHLALQELDGNMATAVVDPARFPNLTVVAKSWSSPVEYLETKHGLVFASTTKALQDACEKVLGFKPALGKIKTLSVGELLYLDGDKIEMLEFEPKASYSYKRYTNYGTGYSHYSGTSTTGRASVNLSETCESCGCTRTWHGEGGDFTGRCSNKVALSLGQGYWYCRCEAFVAKKNKAQEYCDGCGRSTPMGELKEIGSYFFCVAKCVSGMFPTGPTSEQLRKSAEEIVAAQVAAANEFAEGDEWSSQAWEARENELHEQALKLASNRTGLTAEFINWVLFLAPIELFEADKSGYLTSAHTLAEGAYKDLEREIRGEVVDMEIARWEAGDFKKGSWCEECSGYIAIADNGVCPVCKATACAGCGGVVQNEGDELCEDCNAFESCGVVVELFSEEEVGL